MEFKIRAFSVGKMLAVALTNLRTPFCVNIWTSVFCFAWQIQAAKIAYKKQTRISSLFFCLPYPDFKADVLYSRRGLELNYLCHKCTSVVRINTLEWKSCNVYGCFLCFVTNITDINSDTLSDRRDVLLVQSGYIHHSDKDL
jgi:hypothetical protein